MEHRYSEGTLLKLAAIMGGIIIAAIACITYCVPFVVNKVTQ